MGTTTVSRRTFVSSAALGGAGLVCAAAHANAALAQEGPSAQSSAASDGAANAVHDGADASFGAVVEPGNTTYGVQVNPQADPHTATTDYSAIFQPLQIGTKTLKNRIGKSAAGSETQYSTDWPSDTTLAYYGEFAKGGVAMICYEMSTITSTDMSNPPADAAEVAGEMPAGDAGADGMGDMAGMDGAPSEEMPAMDAEAPAEEGDAPASFDPSAESGGTTYLDLSTDDGIAAHAAIADYLHQYDTVVLGQMQDMMMMNGCSSTHASVDDLEPAISFVSHMQTTEEVQAEIQDFVNAGERYYKAGFDGVELNASCNHYFSTFLSRYANCERTDQYDASSIENRCRVLTEIIEGIRERVGEDFIIQVLYSGVEECVDHLGEEIGCTTVDEACEMARVFEAAGANSLHIRSEAYGHHCAGFMPDVFHMHEHGESGYGGVIDYGKHFGGLVDGSHDGYGALIEVAAKIKSCVSIPVGVVGSMDVRMAPDLINDAIAQGKIDFVLATRSLMADPALPNKLAEGRRDECTPCTHCMTCFVAPFDRGNPMYCRVNPAITRALSSDMPEGYDPEPAAEAKKVVVVGGGVAGMEAARIAAQRGHEVTLYEKEDELGGRLDLVQTIKGPHEKLEAHKEYLINQLGLYGVNVVTGTEATADGILAEAPDAVVVAVGETPATLDIPGAEGADVIGLGDLAQYAGSYDDLPLGERVVIVGAQFQACELAINLLKRGVQVTMVNTGPEGEFFMGAPTWPREQGTRWLANKGLKIYHEASISEVNGEGLVIGTSYNTSVTIPFDTLVVATPGETNRALYDELVADGSVAEVYAVGDCYAPGTIANATARANIAARWIAREGDNPLASSDAAAGLAEGEVYTATATGIGDVTVAISVSGGAVVDASVDTSNETDGIGRDLGEGFAEQVVGRGAIDAVSGATVTSTAVAEALADCLAQAGLA